MTVVTTTMYAFLFYAIELYPRYKVTVTGDSAPVYGEAATGAPVIARLKQGDVVTSDRLEYGKDFMYYRVEVDGQTGYVMCCGPEVEVEQVR